MKHLLLDGSRGIYVPQAFANHFARAEGWSGMHEDDIRECEAGPDADNYWDAWDCILRDAKYIDPEKGDVWCLWQDDDLYVIDEQELLEDAYDHSEWPPGAPVYK